MTHKVSFSSGGLQTRYGDLKAIEIAKDIGADGVNFDLFFNDYRKKDTIYSKSDDEIFSYFSKIREKAEELNISIPQTHGCLHGFVNDKIEDDALVKNVRLDMLASKALGAEVCVIHPVSSIWLGLDADPDFMRDLNFDMYCKILPYAKEFGVKIALETFLDATVNGVNGCDFFGNPNELLNSYNRISSIDGYKDFLTLCVDVGHSNVATRFGHPNPADVIRLFGNNVSLLHLHDNNGLSDQHRPPMMGNIDWNDVLKALDEVGFKGFYNLELNVTCFGKNLEIDTVAFAIKVMKNIIKNYYGENA